MGDPDEHAQRAAYPDLATEPAAGIRGRILGQSAGLLRLDAIDATADAVTAMASQARRELNLLTPDLEPHLYDRQDFIDAVRRLAITRRGHLPVRLLLIHSDAAPQRSLRLIELARRLTSAVQIAVVPEELAEQCDAFLLADDEGYCLRRKATPSQSLANFADPGQVRALRREFDDIWQQAEPAVTLRRLHL